MSTSQQAVGYYRLNKILKHPGIRADRILNEFSSEQIEGIYPTLSQPMVESLIEEL